MFDLLEILKGRLRDRTAEDHGTVAAAAIRYLVGGLSAEEVHSLNERLRDDRQARREFARVLVSAVKGQW